MVWNNFRVNVLLRALAFIALCLLLIPHVGAIGAASLACCLADSILATASSLLRSRTTIVFATHYLEEADAFADRAVLMAHGRVVADGPTTEIKARVGRQDSVASANRGLPANWV